MYPDINRIKCINCKICIDICPYEVFGVDDNAHVIIVKPENCIECGECIRNCEQNAIILKD